MIGHGNDIAARAVNLIGEGQGHRLPGHSLIEITIKGDDAGHFAHLSGRQDANLITGLDLTSADQSGKAAKIKIGAIDPLHRHTKRLVSVAGGLKRDGFQMIHQAPAKIGGGLVPRHVRRQGGDIVTHKATDRQGNKLCDADLTGKGLEFGDNRVKAGLTIVNQIHLINGQDDIFDTQQMAQIGVSARLG